MYSLTHTFCGKYTDRIVKSQDGTTSIKYQIILKYNFYLNDSLTKSNRTTSQSYKVEERTFGTPCICKPSIDRKSICLLTISKTV